MLDPIILIFSREFNGTRHLLNSGYLELAEVNDLIIVAPQAIGNHENQIGCWDTYGLTGRHYGMFTNHFQQLCSVSYCDCVLRTIKCYN